MQENESKAVKHPSIIIGKIRDSVPVLSSVQYTYFPLGCYSHAPNSETKTELERKLKIKLKTEIAKMKLKTETKKIKMQTEIKN